MLSRHSVVLLVAMIGCKAAASKQDWEDSFEPLLVNAFCEPSSGLFRTCFDVDEAGCRAEAQKVVHVCVNQFDSQLPERMDDKSGRDFGTRIGECAGNAYEADLRAAHKFKDSIAKCHDPSAWTK
jgi:hypothetical protein